MKSTQGVLFEDQRGRGTGGGPGRHFTSGGIFQIGFADQVELDIIFANVSFKKGVLILAVN
jgi:hypothetical protein